MSDGLLDGAKSLSSSLNASRDVSKELSKSIADVQKEAVDVLVYYVNSTTSITASLISNIS